MILAPQPKDEFLRMQALRALNILDSGPDPRYDCITSFAAGMLQVPMCSVTLIDVDREWSKSVYGFDDEESPRNISICGHAIYHVSPDSLYERIFEVPDTKQDERFFDNPLVVGDPYIRSYMAYVLLSECGRNIGTLCAIDTVPREYSELEKRSLTLLGVMVENLIAEQHHLYNIERRFK